MNNQARKWLSWVLVALGVVMVLALGLIGSTPTTAQVVSTPTPTPAPSAGGPVVLMGIDAENGGPNGHGPPATYTNLVNNIMAQTTKAAPVPLLVIGKKPGTNTQQFWDTVFPGNVGITGGAAILADPLTQYKMIAIVSDQLNTPSGGLTCHDEDPALDDPVTQAKIAAHVNAGGGLLGLSSDCPRPYQYISGVAQVGVTVNQGYFDIDPTADGLATGVNDTLDVCCWHDWFDSFPSFLKVLAFVHGSNKAAAIGGKQVVVPTPVPITPTATPAPVATHLALTPKQSQNPVDTDHTVNALVKDQFNNAMQGQDVTFVVTGASGTIIEKKTTDRTGTATLTYHGPAFPGTDTITACVERDNQPGCSATDQPSDVATKEWILPVSTPNCAVDLNKETGGGQIIARNGDKFSFGGNAKVGPQGEANGEQQARDHGPVEPFTFHGNVIAVICEAANPTTGTPGRATIFATSTNAGSVTALARIDVTDAGESGRGSDTYRFRLATNYDTGEQPLKSGNIQIHKS